MAQEAHGGELPKEAQELAAAQKQPPPEEEAHSPQACSSLSTVSSLPCPNHDTTSDADVEQKPTQNPKNATPSDTAPVDDTGSTTKGDLGPGTTAQATADSTVGGNGGVITGVLDGMFSAVKEIGSAVTTVASSAVSAVLSVGAVSAYDGRPENTKETGTGIGVSGRCTVAPDKAFFTLKFCAVVDRRFAADTVICVGHDFFGGWGQGHLMARELHSGSKRSAKVIASVTFYIPLDDNILVQLSEGSIQYKYAKSDGRLEYEFLYDYSNRLVRPFKQSQLCNGQSFVIHDDLVVFAYSREIASPTLQAYLTWWWNGGFETNIGAQVNPPSAVADLLSVFREIEQIKIHNPRTKKSAQKNEHIFMEPVVQSWLDGLKNSQKPIDLNKLILILLLVQQLKLYKILKPPIIEYFLDQFPTTPIACANVPSAVGQSSRLIEGAISLCVSAYAPHTFSWLLALPFIASANSTQSILYYGVIRIPGIPICHSSATYASVDSSHEHFDVNFARISECEVSSRTASLHAPTWERVLSLSLGFGIDFACFAMMEILEANSKSWIHADELTALFLTKTPLEISKIPICPQKPLELLSKYLSYSVGTRENITALNKYNQAVRFIMNYYLCVSNSSVVHAASSLHNNLQEVISQVALLSTHAYQQICIQENSVNEVMAAFNFLDTIACWPLCDPCVLAAVLQGRRVPADPPSSNSLVESILSVHHLNGLMVVKNYPMLSSVHSPILHKYLKSCLHQYAKNSTLSRETRHSFFEKILSSAKEIFSLSESQNIFSEMIIAELRHANIEMVLGCVPLPQYLELYTARSLTTEAHFILSECIALVNTTVDKVMKGLLLWHEVQVILNAPVKLSELVGFLPISSLRKPCNIVSQLELYQKVHSQAVDVQHIVKALHKAVGDQFEPKHPLYNVLSWCLSRMAPLDPLNFTKMEQITVLPSLIKEELVCFETLFSSLVFRKMWYQTLKALTSYPAEHSEESVLSHIVLKVCKPAHTEYTALSAAIFSRTASVSNVAKFFSDAADSTLDLELAAMRQEAHVSISLEDIKSQVVASCNIVKVAAVVNSTCILQECLSLRFVSDETWAFMGQIAKCETSNLPLSVITSQVTSLMATLSQISESHLRILHHLSSSSGRELFGFLTSPGVFNEFRSFYDIALASIAAENTKDQDKIKTLAKVNTDLEVLLKARRNATPILNALHSLLGIPNASATAKEIIELSKSVDWLQSLLQQNMGDRGARTVTAMRRLWNLGHLLISHDQVRAYCDAEHFWSLQDLHDMQAVLLLIPQQEELSSTLFAECIGKIHQLQDLHRSMFSSGKPQKPVELGDGVLVWARKLQEYIINCEMELKKWRQLVKAFRSEFYELNLFTTVQLVNIHDVCDFTHLDFEEFELLKRISNSLTSERIQYTLSNISATERYERLWRLFCALKPQSIPNLISSPPCLAFHTFTGSIFHTALTVYYVAKQAPTAETFLLCTEETSDEDVTLLLKRAYFPGRERYMQFCLCDIGKLSVVMQSKIMKYIKQCSSIAVNLVIIGDERCASFTALSGNIKKLPEVSVEQLRDFFFPRITHPSTATPSFSAVVVAGPSGCGKTLTIQRRVRKGAYSYIPIYNANSVTVFSHLPHHPLSEHIHLDLGFFAQGPLGSFLFNLLILKQICGPRGTLRHIPSMAQVYIEVTYPLSAILESNSGNYFFGLLPKMSPLPAPSPTDCSGLDTEIWGIPAFQRVCKLLYCHQGPNCRNVWASQADRMPPNQCVSILLENCGITNPSWRALDFFWKFLSTQSQPIDNSPFCDDVITEWHGFAKFVVKFLITTSRDFACRRQTEALLKSDDITRFNPCKKWHDSEHPTIFFSESSLRFFGFNLDRNGCAITQPGLGLSPEMQGQLIDPNLIPILTHNGVNFNANYESLTRRQRLHILFVSFGICLLEEEAYDPDPCYELTTDNMRKIIAIKLRLESGIPVIISGHTGCGKTALVTFMSSIMPFAILHTMTAHGGVDEDMIRKRLLEIVELAEQDETTTRILFIDEMNACSAMDFLKTLFLDGFIDSTKRIPSNMRLIGACNPYLVRSPEQIMRMESNGLGFSSRNCTTICNIPVRHLIYRVNPLPPQMLELVWDFGSLDLNSESSYIKCIITKSAENMDCRKYRFTTENAACLANVFSAAQQAMRGRNDDLGFVSLRDVHRATQVFWYFMRFESDRCPNLSNRLASLCEMQRYEPVSNFIRASILALFVAYETRLDNSDVFRSIVCKALKIQIGHYTREIKLMLDLFSSSLELSPGIARNTALIENFFMMVVAIELRLPLFIVGKPGTSKSLAKAVLKANLNGKFSPSPFFTPFPDIRVISFQCSPQTTSERLVETFAKAIHLQGDDNIMNTKYVVFLDEVGLAEDSTHLPLKVLHMLLDSEKYKSVSVVGISNWALDPAKMNRALWHTVRVPDIDELILTARRICSAFSPSVGQRMGEVIVPVARAYLKVYNKMQPNTSEYRSDFFGLRDYYSLLKMMCSWLHRHPDSQALPQEEIDLLVRRSFSATESTSLILNIFYEELSLQVPATPFPSSCDGGSLPLNAKRTLDCIVQCLQGDSRFLLLMSDASLSCLDILFEKDILVRSNCEVIYGSCFPKDQEYAQVCQDISRIKTCMEVGRTVVLVRSMHIYESLYDLLNQYWIQWAGHRFTELGLGNERVQCRVDPEFRVVIAAERSSVLQDFPVPLVNRLEKHYLSVETMLSEEQHKIVDKLRYLLDVMNSQGHLVVGFRTLAHLKALIGTLDHKDINYVTKLLLQMMSPESVLQSGNKEWIIWYFNCQYLHSFYDLVVTPSFTDRKNNLLVITTHSEAFPVQLFQKNVTNAHVHLVEEFKTSSEVAASIQSILSCDGIGIFVANFPFVSVDMVLQVQHLIENGTSSASGKKFYIVVHYPRAPLEGQTSLVRRGWMQVHIDTLFPEQFFFPQPCVSFEEPSLFNIMEKHALWGVVTVSCVAGVYARISQKKIALDPPQEMNVLTKLLTADKGFIEFFLSLVKKYLKEWESKNTSLPRTWLDSVAGDIALVSRHVTLLSASQQCAITQCEEVCAPIVEFLRESSGLFLYDEGTSCIKQLWIELGKCLLPLASTLDPSLVSSHSGEFPFSWAICTLLEQLWEVSEQTSPNCVEQTLQTQFELCLRNSALLTEKFSESAFALRQAYIKDSLHFMYRYIVGISQTAEITRAEFDWGLILLRDALTHEATDADTLPHMFIVVHKTLHLLRAEFTILHVITEVEPQTIAQLPCEFSKGELLRVMLKAIASKNFAETSRYFVTQRIRPLVLDVLLANSSETRDKCHNYWLSSEVSAIYWFHFQNKDTVFIETICSILKQQDSICRKIISALGAHIHHLAELKPEKNERDKFYRTGGAVVIDIVNTLLHDHFLLENDQAILLALVELINTLVTNQNTVGFCSELLYFLVQVSNNKNWAIHSQITTLLSNVDYSSVIQNALFCLVQKQKVESMCKQSLLVIQHFYSSQVTVFTVAVERLILQISGEMAMANPSSLSEPQVRLLDYTARYCVMHSDVDNIYRKLFLMKVIVRKFGKDALLAAASQHQQRFPWMKQMIECDSHYLFSAPTKVFSVYGENYSRLVRGLQSLTLTPPDLRDTPTILSLFSDEHQNSNRLVRCIESSNYPPLVKNFAIRLCTRCFTPTPPLFPPSATKIHSSILMLVLHVGAVVSKPTSSLIAPLSVLFSTPHVTVNLYIPTMPHDEAYASVMATAMGTHGVFRCNSCGAYVIVGECGKPMATAKCTCGQLVGGSNHTPVPNMKAVHNFVDTSARGFDPDSQVPVTRGHSQLQLTLLRILIIATLLAAQLSGYTLISSSSKLCGVLENLISLAVRTLGISPEDIILLLHLVLKRLSMIANVASEFEWKTAKGRDTWEDFVIQTCISPELENPTNSLRAATLLISKSSATQSPLSCALQETSTSLQITDENGKFLSVQPLSLWRYRATPSFEALCNHVQQLTSTGHTTHSGLIYMCTKYRQLLVLRYLPSVLKVRKQVESLHASWKRNPSTTISDLAQTHNIPTRKHIRNVYRAFQAMYAFFPHYLPASFLQSVSSSIKNEWNPDYLSDTASVDRFAPALCERGVACTALILAMVGLQNEFIGVMSRSPQRHTPIPHSPVPLELVTEYHIVSFKFSTLRDLVFKCSDIGMNYGEGDQVTWDLDCAERCLSNSIEAGKRPLCGQLGTHSSPYGRNTYQQGVIKAVQTIRETIKPQERIGTHIGGSILNSLFTYCTIPSSLKAIETALCFLRVTGSTISPATTTPDSTLLSSYFVETLKVPTEDPLVRLCDGRQLTFHHLSSLWGLVDLASTFSVINACSTAPHSELSRIAFPHVSPAYREQMSKGVQLDLNTFMHGSCVDLISILTELRELALFKFEVGGEYETPTNSALKEWITTYIEEEKQTSTGHLGAGFTAFPQSIRVTHILHCWTTIALYVAPTSIPSTNHH